MVSRHWAWIGLVLLAGCTHRGGGEAEAPADNGPNYHCAEFNGYQSGQKVKVAQFIDEFRVAPGPSHALEFLTPGHGGTAVLVKPSVFISTQEPYQHFRITYISESGEPIRVETYTEDATILQSVQLPVTPAHQLLDAVIDQPNGTKTVGLYDGGGVGLISRFCAAH
jgi:hypothetical protein